MTQDFRNLSDNSAHLQELSLLCHKCSYQLIGMPRDGQCPECRHSVSLSRKAAIAEEAVAGIATQGLAGVCAFLLARNFCLFGMLFFTNALPGLCLFLAITFELIAGLALRGVLPIAQTPTLLKKHTLLHYIQHLWGVVVAWPFFIALIVIGALIKRTELFILFIASIYFINRSILWAIILYGLRHRAHTRRHHDASLLLALAAAGSLLLIAAIACIIALGLAGQIGLHAQQKLLLQSLILGTTITAALLGASAWLVSKPAWEEKLQN